MLIPIPPPFSSSSYDISHIALLMCFTQPRLIFSIIFFLLRSSFRICLCFFDIRSGFYRVNIRRTRLLYILVLAAVLRCLFLHIVSLSAEIIIAFFVLLSLYCTAYAGVLHSMAFSMIWHITYMTSIVELFFLNPHCSSLTGITNEND